MRCTLLPLLAWALVALACFVSSCSVEGSIVAPDANWVLSLGGNMTTACASLSPLLAGAGYNEQLSVAQPGDLAAGANTDCALDVYPSPPPAAGAGRGIEGLSLTLSAVDAKRNTLYVIESVLGGNGSQVLAASPLRNRASVTRNAITAPAISMCMAPEDEASPITPLLMLTSDPVEIRSVFPTTGQATTLLSEAQMDARMHMSHAVAGVLALNDLAREIVWVGLSSLTPPAVGPTGVSSLNTSALYIFALGLDAPPSANTFVARLLDVEDVISVQWAAELSAFLLVTSAGVRAAPVPSGGLLGSGWTNSGVRTYPIRHSSGSPFNFDAHISGFVEGGLSTGQLHTSTHWQPLAKQLLVGVHTHAGGGVWTNRLLTLTIEQSTTGTPNAFALTNLGVISVPSLPLLFQSGLSQLDLLPPGVPDTISPSATTVTMQGFGFGQPLVHDDLFCVFQGVDSAGTRSVAQRTAASVSPAAAGASSLTAQSATCPLPAGMLSSSPSIVTLEVSLRAMRDYIASEVRVLTVSSSVAPSCPPGEQMDVSTGGGGVCAPCPENTWKADSSAGPCITCPVSTTVAAPIGSTDIDACVLDSPCSLTFGEDGRTTSTDDADGADEPLRLGMLVDVPIALWTPSRELSFRAQLASDLQLYLGDGVTPDITRISPMVSVVADGASRVFVTFDLLPATQEAADACADPNGYSPGTMAAILMAYPQYNSTVLRPAGPGGPPPLAKMSFAECVQKTILAHILLGASIIALFAVWALCPCRVRGRKSDPVPSPRARSWELFPTVLPLIAVAFDIYFVAVLPSYGVPFIVQLVAIALLVVSPLINLALIVTYSKGQMRPSPAGGAVKTWRVKRESDLGAAGGAGGGVVIKTKTGLDKLSTGSSSVPSLFAVWRSSISPASKFVALVAAVLNIHALGLYSSQLSLRSRLWHVQWDPSLVPGGLGYNSLVRWAGVRSVLLRSVPMLVLQGFVISALDCPLYATAPIVANVAALFAILVRILNKRAQIESDPSRGNGKYAIRKKREHRGEGEPEGEESSGEGSQYVEEEEEASSTSDESSSGGKRLGSRIGLPPILAGDVNASAPAPKGDALAAAEGSAEGGGGGGGGGNDDEGHFKIASPGADGAQDVPGLLNRAPSLPGALDDEHEEDESSFVEVELTAEEEEARKARQHTWIQLYDIEHDLTAHIWLLAADADSQMSGGTRNQPPKASFKRRMSQADVDALMAAREVARERAEVKLAERINAATMKQREVDSSDIYVRIDDANAAAGSDTIGADDVVLEVEQFDEQGLPFNPSIFHRFKAPKSAVAAQSAARRIEAAKPEVVSRREVASRQAEEIARAEHVWLVFTNVGSRAHGTIEPEDEVKAVEQFTPEGALFAPAFFKRFVKKHAREEKRIAREEKIAKWAAKSRGARLPPIELATSIVPQAVTASSPSAVRAAETPKSPRSSPLAPIQPASASSVITAALTRAAGSPASPRSVVRSPSLRTSKTMLPAVAGEVAASSPSTSTPSSSNSQRSVYAKEHSAPSPLQLPQSAARMPTPPEIRTTESPELGKAPEHSRTSSGSSNGSASSSGKSKSKPLDARAQLRADAAAHRERSSSTAITEDSAAQTPFFQRVVSAAVQKSRTEAWASPVRAEALKRAPSKARSPTSGSVTSSSAEDGFVHVRAPSSSASPLSVDVSAPAPGSPQGGMHSPSHLPAHMRSPSGVRGSPSSGAPMSPLASPLSSPSGDRSSSGNAPLWSRAKSGATSLQARMDTLRAQRASTTLLAGAGGDIMATKKNGNGGK